MPMTLQIRCTIAALAVALFAAASAFAQAAANPAHAHIGHLMTNRKDTPGTKRFLATAIADMQVAMEEVERADLEGRINDFWLYGGYVLNALDPGPETDALLKTARDGAKDEQEGDEDAIRRVHVDAFGGDLEARLVDVLRERDGRRLRAGLPCRRSGLLLAVRIHARKIARVRQRIQRR